MRKSFLTSFGLCAVLMAGQVASASTASSSGQKLTNPAASTEQNQCQTLFQAWFLNRILEEGCGFDSLVSSTMGPIAKQKCPSLSQEQIKEWSREVLVSAKHDIDGLGREKFCRQNKAGHDDLEWTIKNPQKFQESYFRPGITVQQLYDQKLDSPYSTVWSGRLEKSDGAWRDVYFETNDKFVAKGFIRFNCAIPKADIDLIIYPDGGSYDPEAQHASVRVHFADQRAWAKERFEPLAGEDPPYLFYLAARKQFCR